MDLRAYLSTLRRSWWLLAVPVVAGLVVAFVALGAQTPKYLSTAKVYVSVGNTANANDLVQANGFAQSAAANFAALAEQPYVLHAVRTQLDLPLTSDQIADELTTSVEDSTSIISIDVVDPSPTRAARIANTTAAQLSTAVSVLNPSAADGTQNVKVTVVRTAGVDDRAVVPNRPLGLALGLLGGLLLGVVLIILRELLDTRVRSAADLQQLTGAPVVGQIPRTAAIGAAPLVMADGRGSAAAEGFRSLQLSTEYLRAPHDAVVLAIASAVPAEGKSTVAANLALALAAAGHRVALVDADLRRPRLHAMFGLDDGLGLTEVLIGRADLHDVVQPWGVGEARIAVVPAGSVPPNPGELLQSPRLRAALDRLAEEADVVVVDGPPLLAVADSAVLARTADAVLFVASLQRSHRGPVLRAVAALDGVGARVLGTVATMTRPSRADSDAYLRYAERRRDDLRPAPSGRADVEDLLAGTPAEEARPARARRRSRRPAGQPAEDLPTPDRNETPGEDGTARVLPAADESPVEGPASVDALLVEYRAPVGESLAEDLPALQASAAEDVRTVDDAPVEDLQAEDPAPARVEEPLERVKRPRRSRRRGRTVRAEEASFVEEPAAEETEQPEPAATEPATDPTAPTSAAASPMGDDAGTEPGEEPARIRAARPVRIPSADEADERVLRAARRRMSPEELRLLRRFGQQRSAGDLF